VLEDTCFLSKAGEFIGSAIDASQRKALPATGRELPAEKAIFTLSALLAQI